MRYQTLDVVEVAVAHATGDVPDADLVSPGLLQIQHLDFDALTGLVMDGCLDLHGHAILGT